MRPEDALFTSTSVESPAVSFSSVPAYHFEQYPLPNGSSQPSGITSDSSGMIWFVEQGSNQIGRLDPRTGNINEFDIPTKNGLAEEITADRSDNIWFTELDSNQLGTIARNSGSIIEYNIPSGIGDLPCGPIGVSSSSDGNVWITCEFSNQIDEFFPSNGSFDSFDLPVFHSAPLQIVFDSEGNFWFSAADAGMIGYANRSDLRNGSTSGIREFAPTNSSYLTTASIPGGIPSAAGNASSITVVTSLLTPTGLALSQDGRYLWITEHSATSFDRYDIQSKTLAKFFTSRTSGSKYPTSLPNGIAIDSAGNVWIAEHYGNKIAVFDPTDQLLTEYPIPCCAPGIAGSLYLSLGKNGTVWFTEFYGNQIGELAPGTSEARIVSFTGSTVRLSSANGAATIPISLRISNEDGNANLSSAKLHFQISGVSFTGALQGLKSNFEPSDTTILQNGTAKTELHLSADGLSPGTYFLTVGANLTVGTSTAIYSFILETTITTGISATNELLLYGESGAVIVSVVVLSALFVLFRRRKYRRLSRNR